MKNNPTHGVKLLFAAACAGLLFAFLAGCQNPSDLQKQGGKNPPVEIPSPKNELIEFGFAQLKKGAAIVDVKGTIDKTAKTVVVKVPYGTDLKKLSAVFKVSEGASVSIGTTPQQNYVTENDFTKPLIYTVTAKDGTVQSYTITVTHDPASSEKQLTLFGFAQLKKGAAIVHAKGTIDQTAKTVVVKVPHGTDITKLKAVFNASLGAAVSIGTAPQTSKKTENDFSSPLTYTVKAEDGTTQDYTVTVTYAPASSEKQLTKFIFGKVQRGDTIVSVKGTIDEANKTVAVEVPHGTDVTKLTATFKASLGAAVSIGTASQESGITENNFSSPLTYTVTAEDGTTQDYTVTVTQAPASSEKQLKKFMFDYNGKSVNGGLVEKVEGTISEDTKTVTLIIPADADEKKLKASFTTSPGATVFVGTARQENSITENDFSSPLTYTVKAEDGSTQDYTVTVQKREKANGKLFTAFTFEKKHNPALTEDVSGSIMVVTDRKTGVQQRVIFIKFPAGTKEEAIKALKPTFSVSDKAKVSLNGTALTSTKTAADFYNLTKGTDITVTAENGTSFVYNVVVEVDLPKASKADVEKYFGSYRGTIDELGDAIIVLEEKKVTLYSESMSMDYVNVEWEKKDDGSYTCTTYKTEYDKETGSIKRKLPHIKNAYGRGGYTFVEKGGKIIVLTNIMGVDTQATKDKTPFVWTPNSGYAPVGMHL
ncbi:MAG: hypothetical protein P1P65_08435 [Treponema sp.]